MHVYVCQQILISPRGENLSLICTMKIQCSSDIIDHSNMKLLTCETSHTATQTLQTNQDNKTYLLFQHHAPILCHDAPSHHLWTALWPLKINHMTSHELSKLIKLQSYKYRCCCKEAIKSEMWILHTHVQPGSTGDL